MKLSFVSPVYFEEEIIEDTYSELKKTFNKLKELDPRLTEVEYVFVNNHSSDRTCELIKKLHLIDPSVKLIRLSRNFGFETAYSCGIRNVTGDVVIMLDGDLQDPPHIAIDMYRKYLDGHQVVLGKRIKRRGRNFILKIMYKLFYKVMNKMSDSPIFEDVGEFKLVDKKIVELIRDFKETDKFIRGLVAWLGYDPVFVEYVREERKKGKTSFNFSRLFSVALDGITSFSTAPLRFFSYLGGTISAMSLFAAIYVIVKKLLDVDFPWGFPTLFVAILFFGGMNLIGIGVIGEYVGRIFREVKNRPEFLIEYMIGFDDKISEASDK